MNKNKICKALICWGNMYLFEKDFKKGRSQEPAIRAMHGLHLLV